jgi:hypothetical protein
MVLQNPFQRKSKTVEYYPSANEELVEEALRKIAVRQQQGFHEKATARSGVAFSLYELRQELAAQGGCKSIPVLLPRTENQADSPGKSLCQQACPVDTA